MTKEEAIARIKHTQTKAKEHRPSELDRYMNGVIDTLEYALDIIRQIEEQPHDNQR